MFRKGVLKPAKVIEVRKLSKSFYLLKLELLENIAEVKPFNFFMVWIPGVESVPMSVADLVDNELSIVFRIRGRGTQALLQLKKGSFIGLQGPFGRGLEPPSKSRILVVCGGVGIAPAIYFARYAKQYDCFITIAWGVRETEELFDIVETFKINIDRIEIATEDCRVGFCGTVLDLLKHIVQVERFDVVVGVGPTAMLAYLCKELAALNPYIALETIVKCGMGMCGSCYIPKTKYLLCRDGPVFRCDEVIEYLKEYEYQNSQT